MKYNFITLPKLKRGDSIAIVSPSFAAPGVWPDVYELCLSRLKSHFDLNYIEYPSTSKVGASAEERAKDLIDAFENPDAKAVMASLGGDDQVTYIKNLPSEPFKNNPKPFFGFSDNSHFINHLWKLGIPAYYGTSLFTEFGIQGEMHPFTLEYIDAALFKDQKVELKESETFNDIGLDWFDKSKLSEMRRYQKNEGWYWDGDKSSSGVLWGGCLESVDEMLRHKITVPTLDQFEEVVLALETSEDIPSKDYVRRVVRALGELGILSRVKGILVGRPQAWSFDKKNSDEEKVTYKESQREIIINTVRKYNSDIPIVQNVDFGHTSPQIPLPFGKVIYINSNDKKIFADF